MIDTVTLNPTQYFILVVGCYCAGWLSYWLADTVKEYLNNTTRLIMFSAFLLVLLLAFSWLLSSYYVGK